MVGNEREWKWMCTVERTKRKTDSREFSFNLLCNV